MVTHAAADVMTSPPLVGILDKEPRLVLGLVPLLALLETQLFRSIVEV